MHSHRRGTLSGALPRGLTRSGLRQDRILNEAAESADPLKLMRLFGTTEQTAMRYVTAARHERAAKLPRQRPIPPSAREMGGRAPDVTPGAKEHQDEYTVLRP
ncbi:hypothetical protein [Streptomyces sp. NPDC049915]|uniref:hypothetical protein n=1 Tax=Streptomyces sp. NPDC049915 TaxID=3155510 RepID=UPI0034347CF6